MLEWLKALPAADDNAAIFLVLFLNNLGLPLPGNTLLLGAGFLVGSGVLSFWGTFATAAVATFLGTTCSYGLGRHYGRSLLGKIRWLRITHERLRHMEHFFGRYGAKGVFFARFVTLLHPFIGILAGLGKTPEGSFLMYNLGGSASYAFLYIQAGAYFGPRWGFLKVWGFHTAFLLLVLVFVLLGLSLFMRHKIYTLFGHPFYKRKRIIWSFWK
jgi:membrane protein DedA with SNARE-associated domain